MPRISDLPASTVPNNNDFLAIVDTAGAITKKISRQDLLKGSALPANTVTTAAIADGAVTNSKLSGATGELGASWQTYAVSIGGVAVGNGTVVARSSRIGKTINVHVRFVLGTTSAVGGSITLTLPVAANSTYSTNNSAVGVAYLEDAATLGYAAGVFFNANNSVVTVRPHTVTGSYIVSSGNINGSIPFLWGNGDFFDCSFTYEAA